MGILSKLGLKKEESVPAGKSLGGKVIKTAPGDTLRKIAVREYGDESMWEKIYEANKHHIEDAESLYPGTELRLP